MSKFPITPKGHEDLTAELKHLKSIVRNKITQAIAEARAHGDLSENAEYHAAKEQQSRNEDKINLLATQLADAEIIDVSKLSGDTVTFGCIVDLENVDTGDKRTMQIVGEYEADIDNNKLSVNSPVARALINKKAGDFAEVKTPKKVTEYEILNVSLPTDE